MGEVYLARDERLEREVAIKRVRPDRLGDAGFRARFRREARLSARLNHPAIVQVFDLLEDPLGDGGDALVLEWVEGRPLSAIVAEGPLDGGRLLAWGEAIARGLAAAHRQGLLHRDLKAGNVLVSAEGEPKILDFGLARPIFEESDALTESAAVLGTLATMSPEQARGDQLDPRSDLFRWASCSTRWPAASRPSAPPRPTRPCGGCSRRRRRRSSRCGRISQPELCRLVERLLEKDPNARPMSAVAVAEELRRLAAGSAEALGSWPARGSPDATTWVPGTGAFRAPPRLLPVRPRRAAACRRRAPASSCCWPAAAWPAGWRPGRPGWPAAAAAARPLRVAVPPAAAGDDASSPLLLASVEGRAAARPARPLERGAFRRRPDRRDRRPAGGGAGGRRRRGDLVAPLPRRRPAAAGPPAAAGRRRQRAVGGEPRDPGRLPIPASGDPGDTLLTASAIRAALRRAYGELPLRAGPTDVQVAAADYARFVEVRRRFDAGRRISQPADLDELEAIGASSPLFADAHILAATVALGLHRDTKDAAFLQRARRAIERGLKLGGDSPALYGAAIRLALAEGNDEEAGQLLARLEAERPGDPLIVDLRVAPARKPGADRRGDRPAAGRGRARRRHLARALFPGRPRIPPRPAGSRPRAFARRPRKGARQRLGARQAGADRAGLRQPGRSREDLRRARRKGPAARLLHQSGLGPLPGRPLRRGDRRLRKGGGARRRALRDPAQPGRRRARPRPGKAEARALYGRAFAQLEAIGKRVALAPKELTSKAQCLLQLGRRQEAVELALQAFQKYPEEVEVQFHAALVLAAAGEKGSALACARRAIELGFPPRWLELPAFAPLREEPSFRELLGK